MEANNLQFVKSLYSLLRSESVQTFVFGGWAEELQSMISPREHKDIDLLYIGDNFLSVDNFIQKYHLKIIKQFPHKRAFLFSGIMIEIFLVNKNLTTNFFSLYLHKWPSTFNENLIEGMWICSPIILTDYREKHHLVEAASCEYFK